MDPRYDLTLIFERDDIRDSITAHCRETHDSDEGYTMCRLCMHLRVRLATAITEWQQACEMAMASASDEQGTA